MAGWKEEGRKEETRTEGQEKKGVDIHRTMRTAVLEFESGY